MKILLEADNKIQEDEPILNDVEDVLLAILRNAADDDNYLKSLDAFKLALTYILMCRNGLL